MASQRAILVGLALLGLAMVWVPQGGMPPAALAAFFVLGLVAGWFHSGGPWTLGLASVALCPVPIIVGIVRDPTAHNLWPFEILFLLFIAATVAAGVWLARRLRHTPE